MKITASPEFNHSIIIDGVELPNDNVSDEDLKTLQTHPIYKTMVENGSLVESKSSSKKTDDTPPPPPPAKS